MEDGTETLEVDRRPYPGLDGHRKQLERIVRGICPGWLANQAEDIVQVALLKVHRIVTREGDRPLAASYLWRVAHSALVDEIRRLRRRREVPLTDIANRLEAPRQIDPEVRTMASTTGQAIRDCLSLLMTPRRRAVTLHLLGHSVREASQLLSWTYKKTENLVYRGLTQMRECLRLKGVRP